MSGEDGDNSLVQYNVRYRQVLDAMEFLMKNGKTAEVFFPGYEGVARAMIDYAHYQILRKKIGSGHPDSGTPLGSTLLHRPNLRSSGSDRVYQKE